MKCTFRLFVSISHDSVFWRSYEPENFFILFYCFPRNAVPVWFPSIYFEVYRGSRLEISLDKFHRDYLCTGCAAQKLATLEVRLRRASTPVAQANGWSSCARENCFAGQLDGLIGGMSFAQRVLSVPAFFSLVFFPQREQPRTYQKRLATRETLESNRHRANNQPSVLEMFRSAY